VQEPRNVIILGSGCAGLTAAIYTGRAGLEPLVIGGLDFGGQLYTTTDVENFPGFPEGVMGPELIDRMKAQAERFGAEFLSYQDVTELDFTERPIKVTTGSGETYSCYALSIATGASPKELGLPNEMELRGYGVSTCATCDGAFFRDQEIAVVGGGDTAMEEATYLTRFCKKVTIIHRRDGWRASAIMLEKARKNDKIEWKEFRVVKDILNDEKKKVTGLLLEDPRDGSTEEFVTQGLFIAIGHQPNTDLFKGQLAMKDNGYLVTQPDSSLTDVEGIFACGDVQDDRYRQAVTAAGTGCMAALDAERYLESLE